MASSATLNGVSAGRAFEFDDAPWFYQSEILELADAAIAAYRQATAEARGSRRRYRAMLERQVRAEQESLRLCRSA